jgi:DNA-binding NarL/FixJ family response regulator
VHGARPAQLTPREIEIVRLIDEGLSNREIGRRLAIEVATVKNHVHHVLEKLQVHRRGEAAARLRPQTLHA